MSDEEKKQRGRRLRELRLALGFKTQEALADAVGAGFERTYVNRIENGGNAATSAGIQRSLATAMQLRVEDFAIYLDGEMSIDELIARRNAFVHPGDRGLGDPMAFALVTRVEQLPGLKKWLEKSKLTVSQLLLGLAVYDDVKPASRSDGQPLHGWGAFFDDAIAGRLTRSTTGDQTAAEALETTQLSAPARRALHGARKKR